MSRSYCAGLATSRSSGPTHGRSCRCSITSPATISTAITASTVSTSTLSTLITHTAGTTTPTPPTIPTLVPTASTLQVLDIILKHHAAGLPSRMAIAAGVFDTDADHLHKLLGRQGYSDTELWFGHRQSVVHTESGPLLQVDLACTTMLAPIGTSPYTPLYPRTPLYIPFTHPRTPLHPLASPCTPLHPPCIPCTPAHPLHYIPLHPLHYTPLQACSTSSA